MDADMNEQQKAPEDRGLTEEQVREIVREEIIRQMLPGGLIFQSIRDA